jgi:hypothetical protein
MYRYFQLLLISSAVLVGCHSSSEPFLVLSGPKDLTRIEVRDTRDEVVWSIRAEQPTTLSAIYYGVLPEGFVQVVPDVEVLPRALVDGEVIVATTVTLRREFKHYGVARGARGFLSNHSEMVNLPQEAPTN